MRRGRRVSRRGLILTGMVASLSGCLGGGETDDSAPLNHMGLIEIVVDGEEVDLGADRFQAEYADDYAMEFHLHEFDDFWYNEAERRITLAEALDYLPEFHFNVEDDGEILTIDEETYDSREESVTIEYTVNGEDIDPSSYKLDDKDEIVVTIVTDA